MLYKKKRAYKSQYVTNAGLVCYGIIFIGLLLSVFFRKAEIGAIACLIAMCIISVFR